MRFVSRAAALLVPLTIVVVAKAGGANGPLPPQTADGRPFPWPRGMRAAVSLSFDDARGSQLDVGLPLFAKSATHATFLPDGEQHRRPRRRVETGRRRRSRATATAR